MGKTSEKDNPTEFDIYAVADAPNHVAVVGQAVAAVERSIDGFIVTILMNFGKSYPFKFGDLQAAQTFHAEVITFLRTWQSTHDVLNINVISDPSSATELRPALPDEQDAQPKTRVLI